MKVHFLSLFSQFTLLTALFACLLTYLLRPASSNLHALLHIHISIQSALRMGLRLLLPRQGPELPLHLAAHLVHAVERPLKGARGLVLCELIRIYGARQRQMNEFSTSTNQPTNQTDPHLEVLFVEPQRRARVLDRVVRLALLRATSYNQIISISVVGLAYQPTSVPLHNAPGCSRPAAARRENAGRFCAGAPGSRAPPCRSPG